MTHTHLLLVDPQNDFCDLPPDWHGHDLASGQITAPALPVAGAHADLQRVAALIDAHAARIDAITLTLDSHQRFDIAHPAFWQQEGGGAVEPFTTITAAQVRAGAYAPRDGAHQTRALQYLDALESQGRYTLMVWPVHCETGSWGHGVHASVLAACGRWQVQQRRATQHLFKGSNPWTEHYSAVQAEIPDTEDASTTLNTTLLRQLAQADRLLVAGEASSHCVRATCEHLVQHMPVLVPGWTPARLALLTDCMSPVTGFDAQHQAFLQSMQALGVRLETSSQIAF